MNAVVRSASKVALAALALSVGYYVLHRLWVAPASFYDLRVYRLEGHIERDHGDLYRVLTQFPTQATYPPFAALCFEVLTLPPLALAEVLSVAVNLVLAVAVARAAAVAVFPDSDRRAADYTLWGSAVALWAEPVYMTLGYGQINLVLLFLVLADLLRSDESRTKGIGIGLAAGFKVTPAIFIVYLVARKKYRAAVTAVGAFAATICISLAFDAHGTWRYWTRYLFDTTRVGRIENTANQTIRGFSARVLQSTGTNPVEVAVVVVVAVAGLAVSVLAARRLGELWGACCCAVTGLLISPISWSHHWVWCLPIGIMLARYSRRWLAYCLATFCCWVGWMIPHTNHQELHLSWWQVPLSGLYVYFGIAFLALSAWRVRSRVRHGPVPAPTG